MSKVKILADSSVQLTPEEIEKYDIGIVPLTISIDDKTYTDGVDITREKFVEEMDSQSMWFIILARYPAPKPLSMLTTLMPLAQELSILRSAATPPKDAP